MTVSFQHIHKNYQSVNGEVEALRDVSFEVSDGDFVSIVGPSGCGKSTLLSILAGLDAPSSGQVLLDGKPVSGVQTRVGYMPQKDQLFPWRTIWGNVTLGPEIRGALSRERQERIRQLLKRYGLWDFRQKLPSQLSGGMRQRCALIRTMAMEPGILLLDEPFSALDYQTRLTVSEDIRSIIRREGMTALLVTHDISESISMSDQVVVLTARPGSVRQIHDLQLFRGLTPMERRDHPQFHSVFNGIWKELELSG